MFGFLLMDIGAALSMTIIIGLFVSAGIVDLVSKQKQQIWASRMIARPTPSAAVTVQRLRDRK